MSADGRVIAFTSGDPFLTWGYPDDNNNVLDVFVYDDNAQPSIKRIDIGEGWPIAQGYIPGNGPSEWPSLSADGRYVAFQSRASNAAVPTPAAPGLTQVYVFDRVTGTPARISVKPDGTDPDADSVQPQIARDGSLVAFMSQALNLSRNVQTPFDRIYAAVHLEITPAEVTVPGSGGLATFTVTTQQHTQWWIDWTEWYSWLSFESPPMGVGSGTLSARANQANPDPTRRTANIKVHDKLVKLTQLEGLSMTSVAPSSGPSAGGTAVTIRGTGFEPGLIVEFGGVLATSSPDRRFHHGGRDHPRARDRHGVGGRVQLGLAARRLDRSGVQVPGWHAARDLVVDQRQPRRRWLVYLRRHGELVAVGRTDPGHLVHRLHDDHPHGGHAGDDGHVYCDERGRHFVGVGHGEA